MLEAAERCLAEFSPHASLLDTATGWTRTAAAKIGRTIIGPQATLTEGFTLSAAADTMRALDIVASGQSPEVIVPVWGLTRQVAAYRVTA